MEKTIPIEDASRAGALYGTADRNLRLIRTAFGIRISARNGTVHLNGEAEQVRRAGEVIERLQQVLRTRASLTDEVVDQTIHEALATDNEHGSCALEVFGSSPKVVPRGVGQRRYVEAIQQNDLVFCVGPAGTGKTYLAVATAVSLLKQQMINRIVLVRPAVEAGERLGYLPGDLQAKVNPYLRPLFDAMHDMMPFEQVKRSIQNDVIEIMPLAFMRGRTLNHCVTILDEAQNTTTSQMLMFLTRMGNHSKMIVTGDDSQTDLDPGEISGFTDAIDRLEGEAGIATVRLEQKDIVRHPLVKIVVEAYSKREV